MNALQRKISRKAKEFDIFPLLILLTMMGYRKDNILFKSHPSFSSQPSLIHDIEFHESPIRRVVISVNLGLLSAQTPLPSYFMKKMDEGIVDADSFVDFVGFMDDQIVGGYILSIYPEINPALYPDWRLAKRNFNRLLNFRSCSTLHWLFELVFPELGVKAEKAILQRSLQTNHIVLGRSMLDGHSVFGKKTRVPVHGIRVTLMADEEYTGSGQPWAREIRVRMEEFIFPFLKSVGIDLEVILVIRSQRSWAKLHPGSYLGYDMIKGVKAQYQRIRVFHGYLID